MKLFAEDLKDMEEVMKITIHKEEETEQNGKTERNRKTEQNGKTADKPSDKTYLASPLIIDEQDIAEYLGYSVPIIVRKNRNYDSLKSRIRVIDFNVSKGGQQTSSHIFHSYSFKDQYQRALITFRALFSGAKAVKFTVFVLDSDRSPVLERLEKVMDHMANDS